MSVRRKWAPVIEALDLVDPQPTIHSLRHSTASVMAERGATPGDVQAVMGHSQLRTTERYFTVLGSAAKRAASVFDEVA